MLRAVQPDFVRLRTTAVIPGTALAQLEAEGRFVQLDELGLVAEIRRMLAGLEGATLRLESDHVLNLLMELRGDLPRDLPGLLATCDSLLGLPARRQQRFMLARRLGWAPSLASFLQGGREEEAELLLKEIEAKGGDAAAVAAHLRGLVV